MKKIANRFSALLLDSEDPKDDEVSATPSENSSENGSKMSKKKKNKASKSSSKTTEAMNTDNLSEQKAPCNSLEKEKQKASMSTSNTMEAENTDGLSEQKAPCNSLNMPLVWIDLEMTGLNIDEDRILEIACIITDGKLVKTVEGPDLIIHQSKECLSKMGDWCQNHHSANGLVEAVLKSEMSEQEAEQQVLEFVKKYTGPAAPLLAGNSVYVDFMFLKKYMPNLAAIFSHVLVDVSSIKALCFRWYPKDAKNAPSKKNSHRALDDIKESIAELQYLQKTIFKASRWRNWEELHFAELDSENKDLRYDKERVEELNEEKLLYRYTAFGGAGLMSEKLKKAKFEMKFNPIADDEDRCLLVWTSYFETLSESPPSETKIQELRAKTIAMVKMVESYLLSYPEMYL